MTIALAQTTSNFTFIKQAFPGLYSVSKKIEHYYHSDPCSSLAKMRLFLELWVHEIASQDKANIQLNGSLQDKITAVANAQLIPPHILSILHTVRKEANKAVHISKNALGQWCADLPISKSVIKNQLQSCVELAEYLACKQRLASANAAKWVEPMQVSLTDKIRKAIQGDTQACIDIALAYAKPLQQSEQKITLKEKNRLTIDIQYWLDKAIHLGDLSAHSTYAELMTEKVLVGEAEQVEHHHKQAIKAQTNSPALYLYGLYLQSLGQHTRAQALLIKAGEQGHIKAVQALQAIYRKEDPQAYFEWVKKGDQLDDPSSALIIAFRDFVAYSHEQDNQGYYKTARSSHIRANALRAPGAEYLTGLCHYLGVMGYAKDKDKAKTMLQNNWQRIPPHIMPLSSAFFVLSDLGCDYQELLKIGRKALHHSEGIEKANLQYNIALLIMDKIQAGEGIAFAFTPLTLINEAAAAGHTGAQALKLSAIHKKQVKGIQASNTKRPKVDRKKRKQQRKASRK